MKREKIREETDGTDARIDEILEKIASIEAMLDGALLTKHNRVSKTDGSVHVSPAHYVFQYRGADGRRKWKSVPTGAHKAVERLVEAGRSYRALEAEYSALMTERSLAGGEKKNIGGLGGRPARNSKT